MTSPSDAVVAAGGGDDDGNPYLAMRAAKIARNERRLRELGLSSSSSSSSSSGPAGGPRRRPSPSSSPPAVARRRRRPDEFGSATTPGAPPPPARRRSDRILSSRREVGGGSSAVAEGPRGVVVVGEEARTRRRPRFPGVAPPGDDVASPSLVPVVPGRSGGDDDDDDWGAPPAPPPAPPANSVRSIHLDVEALVLGGRDDPDDGPGLRDGGGMLGRMAERPGKECVVLASISAAAGGGDRLRFEGGGARVSFNKYSGVQEWKNSVFLWVNLGAPDSPNEFLDDARMVTWFGGSRTHDGSPAIRELLRRSRRREGRPGGGGGGGEGGGISDVVLWCRRYRPEARAFTPYVCFGRMGYRSHKPGSRPLAFVWDLLDYDGLRFHPDPVVREMFDLFTKR